MSGSSDDARAARVLEMHAALVGIGWFVFAFAGLVGVSSSASVDSWFRALSPLWQGLLAGGVLACAVPVMWPIYLALGWYEASLAARWRTGDGAARCRASKAIGGQAIGFGALSLAAVVVAVMARDSVTIGYGLGAGLALAVLAGGHVLALTVVSPRR